MDTTANSIESYMKRPARYSNVDGTIEMSFGLIALGLATVPYVHAALPKDSVWLHGFGFFMSFYLVLAPFFCVGYFGPKVIKKYITYPRTGYMTYRCQRGSTRLRKTLIFFVSLVIAVVISALLVRGLRHGSVTTLRLGAAIACAASWPAIGFAYGRDQHWKWFVYGLLALAVAAMFLTPAWSLDAASSRGLLLVSCTYLGSGLATLWLYLHHTKVSTDR